MGDPDQVQLGGRVGVVGVPNQYQVRAGQPAQLQQPGVLPVMEPVGAQHDQVDDPVGDQPGRQRVPDGLSAADPFTGSPGDRTSQRGKQIGPQSGRGAGRGCRVDHDHAGGGIVDAEQSVGDDGIVGGVQQHGDGRAGVGECHSVRPDSLENTQPSTSLSTW
ncbi:hypothetical protein [Nocardia farcinica]|uniref:hypothetical protein n=1 Tax=Nocardia farcinica TaxID=37329 RepID=UPI002456FCCD|nr:hypothetical protein [Nocardia farcinica]